jgi:two-component system cell cycle response regulator DivK
MSLTLSDDHFARIAGGARRLEEQAGSQETCTEGLLATAEADVQFGRTVLSRPREASQDCIEHLAGALRRQLSRNEKGVATARQLCVAARESRVTAGRLLSDLGCTDGPAPSRESVRNAVLVVDDYEDSRELVSDLLHGAGFVVRTASNGLEAILAAYEMRPAVILMDVTMPVLDGLEATRLIKAIDAIRDTRVIAYTARPALNETIVNELFAAVLQKPAPLDLVLATVRRCAAA